MTRKQFVTILILNIVIGIALITVAIVGMLRVTQPMANMIGDMASQVPQSEAKATATHKK